MKESKSGHATQELIEKRGTGDAINRILRKGKAVE